MRMRELKAEYDRLIEVCDQEGIVYIVCISFSFAIESHNDVIACTTGFNTTVFNSCLPETSGPAERGESVREQAKALAKTGRTASAGAIWLSTFGDVLNSEAVLEARRIQRQKWQDEADAKEAKECNKHEELEEAVTLAWMKFHSEGEARLKNPDLKDIVKFIVAVEGKEDKNCPSKYNTREKMLKRLKNCDRPWQTYFESQDSDEEEGSESGEESGSDREEDEGEEEGSCEAGSEESASEQEDEDSEYKE
jgi:hypothetical protein